MVLLTPGPCMTSETVRQAAAVPDLNHREPEFLEMIREVKQRLLSVYPAMEGLVPYLIGGSGTAAVEAMVTSYVEPGWKTLVLENGYYSGRVAEILRVHGLDHTVLSFDWLAPWDLGAIEAELARGEYQVVIGTHNETTTGRLNPIQELARICGDLGIHCLIDAMSSFGADPIDFTDLDAVCSSANKCLHGIPGVAFVLAKGKQAERMRFIKRRTYYLHLPLYEGDSPPLTPPVPALAALRQALRELPGGSARQRRANYVTLATTIRKGLRERGFAFAIPEEDFSCTLTVTSLPDGWSWERWNQANRERGFMLYGCKGDLRERFFQVANMGEITGEQIHSWLLAVDEILAR